MGCLVGSAFESLSDVAIGDPLLNIFLGIGSWHEAVWMG